MRAQDFEAFYAHDPSHQRRQQLRIPLRGHPQGSDTETNFKRHYFQPLDRPPGKGILNSRGNDQTTTPRFLHNL
jgi:hypothetical protein